MRIGLAFALLAIGIVAAIYTKLQSYPALPFVMCVSESSWLSGNRVQLAVLKLEEQLFMLCCSGLCNLGSDQQQQSALSLRISQT